MPVKALRWKILLTLAVVAGALWFIYPTFVYYTQYYGKAPGKAPPSKVRELKKKALNLGLDLQGGMYMVLEVDKSKLKPEEAKDAVDRALEVIRNRVDKWGVAEPSFQKIGEDRILVQLPGVLDRERAKGLIGRTAMLEFRLLADEKLTSDVLERIDKLVARKLRGKKAEVAETTAAETVKAETLTSEIAQAAPETLGFEVPPEEADTVGAAETEHPFLSLMGVVGGDIAVPEDNVDSVKKILRDPEVQKLIPPGYTFLWGKLEEVGGQRFRRLYLVKAQPDLTGRYVTDARVTVGQGTDPKIANKPVVLLYFNTQGAARFARITSRNVGKRLAIVLDSVVYSAPVIQERISGGSAQITGMGSMEEAKELAVVLKAGALPAPVRIIEERSVGPTLGADSVRRGMWALVVGFLLVVLFMAIYYKLAGVIADVALILNLLIIAAALAAFHATLTLPGMAGLVLTVGMAVDANVLIFERIREELRAGKRPRLAVEAGYRRATITVLDANITTLIAALVLLKFGTGPIKGFAVVLSIGILASLFTAIFVTRIFFDYLTVVKEVKELSI